MFHTTEVYLKIVTWIVMGWVAAEAAERVNRLWSAGLECRSLLVCTMCWIASP